MHVDPIPKGLSLAGSQLDEEDFIATYSFPASIRHILSDDSTDISIVELDEENEHCTDVRDCLYEVMNRLPGAPDPPFHCVRLLLHAEQLESPLVGGNGSEPVGRVAHRVFFNVVDALQGSGIGTSIIGQEEQILFTKWQACEIHLMAKWAGCKVWTKSRYGYRFTDFGRSVVQLYYWEWLDDPVSWSVPCCRDPLQMTEIGDFPQEFWQYCCDREKGIHLYKRLENQK